MKRGVWILFLVLFFDPFVDAMTRPLGNEIASVVGENPSILAWFVVLLSLAVISFFFAYTLRWLIDIVENTR